MPKIIHSLEARQSYGVYAIVNTMTGKMYIGQTSYLFSDRWNIHSSALRNGKHKNEALQRDWFAYGSGAFEFRILEGARFGSRQRFDCVAAELHHIAVAKAPLYNIRVGERQAHHWLLLG